MTAGDPAQAVSLYKEALETDPDEPLLYYKLSRALDKVKDFAGEKAALQRAIQLNPNLAEAQNQMGYLADRDGDLAQAEGYFRVAVRASPSYVAAWINLAATLASQAKWQDARQALEPRSRDRSGQRRGAEAWTGSRRALRPARDGLAAHALVARNTLNG